MPESGGRKLFEHSSLFERNSTLDEMLVSSLKNALDSVPSNVPFFALTDPNRDTDLLRKYQRYSEADAIDHPRFQTWKDFWASLNSRQRNSLSRRFHGVTGVLQKATAQLVPNISQVRALSIDDLELDKHGKTKGSSFSSIELLVEVGLIRDSFKDR